MEPIVFSFFSLLFWIPAILLLLVAIISFKAKRVRKLFFILSVTAFCIPFLLILITRIDEKIEKTTFIGTYKGTDPNSNSVIIAIAEDETFYLKIDNCEQYNLDGSWYYSRDYDDFIFQAENHQVYIGQDFGSTYLQTDIKNECCDLSKVKLLPQ